MLQTDRYVFLLGIFEEFIPKYGGVSSVIVLRYDKSLGPSGAEIAVEEMGQGKGDNERKCYEEYGSDAEQVMDFFHDTRGGPLFWEGATIMN